MIRAAVTLITLCLLVTANTGQKAKVNKEIKGFIVPRETNLPLVVSQPDCPLLIKDIELHGYLRGGSAPFFKVVNQGTKIITGYEIAYLTGDGNGGGSWSTTNEMVQPGETMFFDKERTDTHIASITESKEILKNMRIGEEMKGIMIFMIVRLKYVDGSVYEDEKVYKYLKLYLDKSPR